MSCVEVIVSTCIKFVCMSACVHVRIFLYIQAFIYMGMRVYLRACTCSNVIECMCARTLARFYVCMRMYECIVSV